MGTRGVVAAVVLVGALVACSTPAPVVGRGPAVTASTSEAPRRSEGPSPDRSPAPAPDPTPIPTPAVAAPVLEPGRFVAVVVIPSPEGTEARTHVIDLQAGLALGEPITTSSVGELRWLADGTLLLLDYKQGLEPPGETTVVRYDPASGGLEDLFPAATLPLPSPDGSRWLVRTVCPGGSCPLEVRDPVTAEVTGSVPPGTVGWIDDARVVARDPADGSVFLVDVGSGEEVPVPVEGSVAAVSHRHGVLVVRGVDGAHQVVDLAGQVIATPTSQSLAIPSTDGDTVIAQTGGAGIAMCRGPGWACTTFEVNWPQVGVASDGSVVAGNHFTADFQSFLRVYDTTTSALIEVQLEFPAMVAAVAVS